MTQSNRLWTIGAVMAMIALLLGGYFLGAQPLLAAAAAADTETTALHGQNAVNQTVVAQLTADNANLPALEASLTDLQKSVPTSADTAPFIDNLNSLANAADVKVTGITVAEPQPYTVPASAIAAAPVETTTETPTDTATAAPEVTAPVAPAVTTNPLITPENFVGIVTTIQLKGSYDKVLDFTKGLQEDDRLFLVTGFTSQREPESTDGKVTATVTGYIYVLKSAATAEAETAP